MQLRGLFDGDTIGDRMDGIDVESGVGLYKNQPRMRELLC